MGSRPRVCATLLRPDHSFEGRTGPLPHLAPHTSETGRDHVRFAPGTSADIRIFRTLRTSAPTAAPAPGTSLGLL
ncbi:hypothetical protein ATKI12_7696 [Kitasatospora sp. Ki12]